MHSFKISIFRLQMNWSIYSVDSTFVSKTRINTNSNVCNSFWNFSTSPRLAPPEVLQSNVSQCFHYITVSVFNANKSRQSPSPASRIEFLKCDCWLTCYGCHQIPSAYTVTKLRMHTVPGQWKNNPALRILQTLHHWQQGLNYGIGVARILSAGVHFFTTQRKLLKLTLALAGGALSVLRGFKIWTISCDFSCKLGLKIFFHRPGGCRCTHCTPLATPMVTGGALRAIIGSKSAISLQRGSVDPTFQVEGVDPPTILLRKLD